MRTLRASYEKTAGYGLPFQYDELEQAKLVAGEQEELEEELKLLEHATDIRQSLYR